MTFFNAFTAIFFAMFIGFIMGFFASEDHDMDKRCRALGYVIVQSPR